MGNEKSESGFGEMLSHVGRVYGRGWVYDTSEMGRRLKFDYIVTEMRGRG